MLPKLVILLSQALPQLGWQACAHRLTGNFFLNSAQEMLITSTLQDCEEIPGLRWLQWEKQGHSLGAGPAAGQTPATQSQKGPLTKQPSLTQVTLTDTALFIREGVVLGDEHLKRC